MAKIFVGIPSIREHIGFNKSMSFFMTQLEIVHNVEVFKIKNKTIAEARNIIVDVFLKSDKDYLLFLDDDHMGHNLEMVDALLDPLINNDEYICAIKCYTKMFPYFSNLLSYSGVNHKDIGLEEGRGRYSPIDNNSGYIACDLVGFGMTLIKKELFNKIQPPYFVSKDNAKEDNYFCDKLVMADIRPIGCFDYVLNHDGIGKENALYLRNKGIEKLREELKRRNPNIEEIVLVT